MSNNSKRAALIAAGLAPKPLTQYEQVKWSKPAKKGVR